VLRPTKTISSEAVLPLPEACVHALAEHRLMVERWKADAAKSWHENDLVFSTRCGLPLDPRNFPPPVQGAGKECGVPVVSVHSTRRTRASLLVGLDVHPRVANADSAARQDLHHDGHLFTGRRVKRFGGSARRYRSGAKG
jgi:integrase